MGMTLFIVDPPTLLSKWVGESEKGLREVFKRAKQASPCILFFDEIEAMAPARTAEDSGQVSQRIVSQLFREIDGLPSSLGIAVVAATNRIDLMEPALLRAGRFDSIIEFPLPGKEERAEILELYMQSLPFRTEVDIALLAGMSEGWTGAELEALCKKAVVLVLEESLASQEKLDYMLLKLTTKHFDQAIEKNGTTSVTRPRAMKL
jgi:transitional endoplasmic reticulum ATPase